MHQALTTHCTHEQGVMRSFWMSVICCHCPHKHTTLLVKMNPKRGKLRRTVPSLLLIVRLTSCSNCAFCVGIQSTYIQMYIIIEPMYYATAKMMRFNSDRSSICSTSALYSTYVPCYVTCMCCVALVGFPLILLLSGKLCPNCKPSLSIDQHHAQLYTCTLLQYM